MMKEKVENMDRQADENIVGQPAIQHHRQLLCPHLWFLALLWVCSETLGEAHNQPLGASGTSAEKLA